MFGKNSYVVVVDNRVFNYFQNLSEAIRVASQIGKSGLVTTVEDMQGNVVKLINTKDRL